MAVDDVHAFPGFLTSVLIQIFFPKPPATFLICFRRGERRKYAVKKVRLNRGSNSHSPGHESDTLTTEPPGRGPFFDKHFRKRQLQASVGTYMSCMFLLIFLRATYVPILYKEGLQKLSKTFFSFL